MSAFEQRLMKYLHDRVKNSERRQKQEEKAGHEGEALIFQGYIEAYGSLMDKIKMGDI